MVWIQTMVWNIFFVFVLLFAKSIAVLLPPTRSVPGNEDAVEDEASKKDACGAAEGKGAEREDRLAS